MTETPTQSSQPPTGARQPVLFASALALAVGIIGGMSIPDGTPIPPECPPQPVRTGEAVPEPATTAKPFIGPPVASNAVPDNPPDPPPTPLVPPANISPARWQPMPGETWATMLPGEWEDKDFKPVPRMSFTHQRPGSKTPYNLRFQTGTALEGGCGVYPTGWAQCRIHDEDHKKVPKVVKTTVLVEMQGDAACPTCPPFLRVTIEGVSTLVLRRVPVGGKER